ncbi:MAG TPA: cobalt-precorrin-5B (C(1))-methyltransferase [Rhodobacteraceae bacterium]|nr:cobalt-precorrin-5B (C(1))-methyltransferase [Paracoccaceae bacterium]
MTGHEKTKELRRGWTTGACAAAAAKSACSALLGRGFLDPSEITLPRGEMPRFEITRRENGEGWAKACIIKDAGDDPDVTHGALICAKVSHGSCGLKFMAGEGVGTVTKPGLPIAVGEPAINPVPRLMIDAAIADVLEGAPPNFDIEISVENGEALAAKTWNPRLGIVGGLSILGTTGIVRPFSCAAWIASIHRGVDVARALGRTHLIAATGATSEATARSLYEMPEGDCLDMGDFVGGTLKYLRRHPVERLTIAGGIGKLTKLAQGAMDLHSGRSQVDFTALAEMINRPDVAAANTALEAYSLVGAPLAEAVAAKAKRVAEETVRGTVAIEVIMIDRAGAVLAQTGF